MTEADKDPEEGRPLIQVIPGLDVPPRSGILCPWNRDDQGPAGEAILCQVWKDWEDFVEWGSDENHRFCRVHCQRGRNPVVRRRDREIRDRRKGRMPAWFKATIRPPEFMFPRRGRRL